MKIEIQHFLLQMFDGWVLKGEKFPSSQDHQLPVHERYTDYCSSPATGAASRSSQNVAMIFFRIHSHDSGFTLAVKKLHNPFRESCRSSLKSMYGGESLREVERYRVNRENAKIVKQNFK